MAKVKEVKKTKTAVTARSPFWPQAVLLILFWGLYVTLSYFAPAQVAQARYEVSRTTLKLLGLTIQVPLFFIWMAILYGASSIYRYASAIREAREGQGYLLISYGLYIILFSSIVGSFLGIIRSFVADSPQALQTISMTTTFVSVTFQLLAYLFIYFGARWLVQTLIQSDRLERWSPVLLMGFAGIAVLYARGVFHNPFRTVSNNPNIAPTYYLGDSEIWVSVVIPTLLTWFLGLATLGLLVLLRGKIKGIIYRKFLTNFVLGITFVLGLTMALQGLTQNPQTFAGVGREALGFIFAIIYAILIAIAVGYGLIARAANKLRAIEEV